MEQRREFWWAGNRNPQLSSSVRVAVESWAGTKYKKGCSAKGRYADCIGFCAGVLDDLTKARAASGIPRGVIGNMLAIPAFAKYSKQHWNYEEKFDGIFPGDVLLTTPLKEIHMMVAGWQTGTIWHCIQDLGVCPSPISDFKILRVYGPSSRI